MISVLVTHQIDETEPYLNLCLDALRHSREVDFEVVVVSAAPTQVVLPKDDRFKLIYDPLANTVPPKIEHFMREKSPKSQYVAFVSDDVMVSEYMLADMMSSFQGRELIMNPMSNSDCTALYEADLHLLSETNPYIQLKLRPDMDLFDLSGFEHGVIHYPRKPKLLIPFQTISFYCTMMNLSVWYKVGKLDERMEYRHNDQDYCLRAWKLGIPSMVNLGAFAFHFGSKTLKYLATPEIQNECTNAFKQKWGIT